MIRIAFCYHPDSALFFPIVKPDLPCTSKSSKELSQYETPLEDEDSLVSQKRITLLQSVLH
jgi:hypothetical protein